MASEEKVIKRNDGVVYVYAFPRKSGKQVPNLSPFAVKLECWLRLHKIKYELLERSASVLMKSSPRGQVPFISYNSLILADSSFIIDYLTQQFSLDPHEGLSPADRGRARAISKLAEESLSFTVFQLRYVVHAEKFCKIWQLDPVKEVDQKMKEGILAVIEERMKVVGIGRKTEEEVGQMGKDDTLALAQCLGDQPFFMGDQPTTVDCSVFGQLSQVYNVDLPYPHKEILDTHDNLTGFMERMKERLWPDYDQIVHQGVFE